MWLRLRPLVFDVAKRLENNVTAKRNSDSDVLVSSESSQFCPCDSQV